MDMDKLVSLCKRRGFLFQSSEIYGGLNGFWDYGPLGAELKRNIKDCWWRTMTQERDDIVGLDASIIMATDVPTLDGEQAISAATVADLHLGVLVARGDATRAERRSTPETRPISPVSMGWSRSFPSRASPSSEEEWVHSAPIRLMLRVCPKSSRSARFPTTSTMPCRQQPRTRGCL